MRIIVGSLSVLIVSVAALAGASWAESQGGKVIVETTAGQSPTGFEFSATLEGKRVKAGDPLNIKFSVKNAAKTTLILFETNPETDHLLEVRDANGNLAPLTEYGKQILSTAEENRRVIVRLKAGEIIENTVQVNKIVKINTPGTYYVTATRRVPAAPTDLDRLVSISSNTVQVVITPKEEL